ncbi:Protein MID1-COMPLEMENTING ACTIVITY 1 [Zea mays]|uniref:Protein MID1-COMPLEMENTING ACTIVITY 1 n=1 Tax=Zea mays TaxID=4577 RepID=A0A1D6PNG8_MAIZE|nr:Protein MID1-COMPLEMENTING ACTIVITY 1 [Zea mays]
MALWNGIGQVASIAQLAGVDAYGLISMIVEAAKTVKRNRETCQLLARRARMIGDLLHQLERTQLMQHMETRNPVEHLEETLRHAYVLITSCRNSSYLYNCCMGGKQADRLREVQNEITFYLQLFPLVSFVDNTRTWERLLSRACPLCTTLIVFVRYKPTEIRIHNPRLKVMPGSYLPYFLFVIKENMDELHAAAHHVEHEDGIRSEAIKATKFENLGSHPTLKPDIDQMEGQVMRMGGLVNLIGGTKGAELSCFTFSHILAATDNFSEKNLVGKGGFGYVYKAHKYNPKTLHKLVDPLLRVDEHERAQIMECVRVAQLCVDHRAKHRPVMSEVVTMLGMAASKG